MKDFFEGIAALHEEVLFLPLDLLRDLQDESWWAANALNWVFMIICFVAFLYWMKQLKAYGQEGTERTDVKSHEFLG
ncbi:DUF6341 family protein [Psychroflexus maritimus]|uniref:Uracil phosphoribosyltransferase n=1 Tax=Psychroflexus maritimus TaxID=2714865 RepID=A0A967E6S0_9FLAO|nr:uracil phosphoribosyltransferase [Psychroflexus maritimus]NGZ90036.1 uracil phosphoribosyltransferase [Psychroflexus maritimus]